ncbi:uncharacterized protein [Chelonus insularis]|uniref:uncharacterized protein n=1 Tax=Chelonus insularis TaxID=460826 RepID=UPI0015895773|nr:uncharacterized protein LOC118072135 [Chelonus insularis]
MAKCVGPRDLNRQRNQFSRNERDHLLNIMREFGQRLEDKNLSILARKEIWMTIDKKFQEGGFSDRSIAQLKKYWQNYKYHNARNKWRKIQEDAFFVHPSAVKNIPLLSCRHLNYAEKPYFMPNESDLSYDPLEQPAVIISDTDTSGSSVTVSVLMNNKTIPTEYNNSSSHENETENEESQVNKTKKMNGKYFLFEPRKVSNPELSGKFIDGENDFLVGKIDSKLSSESSQSLEKSDDDITIDQSTELNHSRNSRNPENQVGEYNMQIDYTSHQRSLRDGFQHENIHVIRQLQLLRQLEAEEHRLKAKLAEMTLKEIHLRILHRKGEREYMHDEN